MHGLLVMGLLHFVDYVFRNPMILNFRLGGSMDLSTERILAIRL